MKVNVLLGKLIGPNKIKAIEVHGNSYDAIINDMRNYWFLVNEISEEALDFLISLGDQDYVTPYARIEKPKEFKEAKEYDLNDIDWVVFWDNGSLNIKANNETKKLIGFKTSQQIRDEELKFFSEPRLIDKDKLERLKKLFSFANQIKFQDIENDKTYPIEEIKEPFVFIGTQYDEFLDTIKIRGFLIQGIDF